MTMAKNYKRFYALLKQNPDADKDELVMSFTDERTTSLREMTDQEFNELCDALQHGAGQGYDQARMTALKQARSAVLVRLQRLGISTTDNWDGIDAFCLSKRIAGKKFAALTVDELKELTAKLEMIQRRGGLKDPGKVSRPETGPAFQIVIRARNHKYAN